MTKKLTLLLSLLIAAFTAAMGQDIKVQIVADSVMPSELRTKMEVQLSNLLTEINSAQHSNRPLNLNGINIQVTGEISLEKLWKNTPFYCEDNINVVRSLKDVQGYQVRDICVTMAPKSSDYKGETVRDLVISFDNRGIIMSVIPATSDPIYHDIMYSGQEIEDIRCRREIVKLIETYIAYYEARDINAINKFFSDNELLVTNGDFLYHLVSDSVRHAADIQPINRYRGHFLGDLQSSFMRNKGIACHIEDLKVHRYGSLPQSYDVTFRQKYDSDNFTSEDYISLHIDFSQELYIIVFPRKLQHEAPKETNIVGSDYYIPF